MKKILFTQSYNVDIIAKNGNPVGGSVVETLVWMEAFHSLEYHVFQFKKTEDERELLPQYQWVELVPIFHSKKGIRWIRWVYYRLPTIFRQLKKYRPDYMYESIPSWITLFYALICRRLKIKLILRIANDNMLDDRILITHSKFERFLIYRAFAMADCILPQNEYQYQTLMGMYPQKKILRLYNPFVIDTNYLKPKTEPKGYLAWVANFRYQKNLKLLFEVASFLQNETFKIAGAHLSYTDDETAVYVEKLKTLPNVEFVGKVSRSEILTFFQQAKFLINTSRYEGFSNTFLEAMVTGTPILTTPNVNPDGIINKHGLGIIFETPEELSRSLNEITDQEYVELSNNCIRHISKYHDHLKLGRDLDDFLQSL
jgi:glycosyltransferase involved in cell wall biosynthesis